MGLRKAADASNKDDFIEDISAEQLMKQLHSDDRSVRRLAARDASSFPEYTDEYIKIAQDDPCFEVREALFFALQQIGSADVVEALITLLSSEDVWTRNAAIEVLQNLPSEIEKHIISLLNDQNSDVRIFAIDILQDLAHASAPQWLVSVLKDEEHVNVVAAAVDRLAEVGSPEMVPAIKEVAMRFRSEAYIQFACNTAISRIKENG